MKYSLISYIDLCTPRSLDGQRAHKHTLSNDTKKALVSNHSWRALRSDMHRGNGHRAKRRLGLPIPEENKSFVGGVSPRFFLGLV